MSRPRGAWAVVVVALGCLAVAGCADDEGSVESPPTTTAAVATSGEMPTSPASTTTPTGRAAGLACDTQQFLQVMRGDGGQYGLSPGVLAALRPEGPPQCDAAFARQTFAGPPEAPGPYDALFGVRPDRSGWGLASVNCRSSESSGSREVC